MKKMNTCIILILILLFTGCNNAVTLSDDFTIEAKDSKKCDVSKSKKYIEKENQRIYITCLENVKLVDGNTTIHLKDYLKQKDQTIESVMNKIIPKLLNKGGYWDGGTTIYQSHNEQNGITIIKCNTLDKNQDVYIGAYNLISNQEFGANLCQ